MDELDARISRALDKPPPLPGADEGGPLDGPVDAMEDISDRMMDATERVLSPVKDINNQVNRDIDRMMDVGNKALKSFQVVTFPLALSSSPVTGIIFLKNTREHRDMSMEDLVDLTQREMIGWLLDVANIAWPGTAAPDAKKVVRDRVGGLVKSYTGITLFDGEN